MTIKQAAAKYGVSPQAVYQRLKKRNIYVEKLTDKETGELTPDGEIVIDNLFNPEKQPFKANSRAFAGEQEKQIKELNLKVAQLELEKKALEEKVEFFKSQQAETNKSLQMALSLHDKALERMLPAGRDEAPAVSEPKRRLTWRERIKGRID